MRVVAAMATITITTITAIMARPERSLHRIACRPMSAPTPLRHRTGRSAAPCATRPITTRRSAAPPNSGARSHPTISSMSSPGLDVAALREDARQALLAQSSPSLSKRSSSPSRDRAEYDGADAGAPATMRRGLKSPPVQQCSDSSASTTPTGSPLLRVCRRRLRQLVWARGRHNS